MTSSCEVKTLRRSNYESQDEGVRVCCVCVDVSIDLYTDSYTSINTPLILKEKNTSSPSSVPPEKKHTPAANRPPLFDPGASFQKKSFGHRIAQTSPGPGAGASITWSNCL